MSGARKPKVVNGIVFVWVESYPFEGNVCRGEHWVSINRAEIVHIQEPKAGEQEWRALAYFWKNNVYQEIYVGTEKIAFQKSADYIKHQLQV